MGTRVCSCVRVRSRAGADDALMRGSCASAARCLRKAIHRWNTHIHSVRIHNACMYLYPCAAGYTDEGIADARPPHTRGHVLRPCARVCACAIGRARIRADTCERVPSAWTKASAFRRRGPRLARLAGVLPRVGVRRGHRRVEHRACHRLVLCMRRLSARRRDALGGSSMRRGPLCAAGPPMRARACVCADVWAPTCVGIAARSNDGIYACM